MSAGPNNASTCKSTSGVGTVAWSNSTNAQGGDNGTYATASLTVANRQSHYLKASNFGFAVPVGATIDGIVVNIDKKASGFPVIVDANVKLVQVGTISGQEKAQGAWSTQDTTAIYGSSADLWGLTWASSQINSTQTGVVLSANNIGGVTYTASVDWFSMTVYYHYDVSIGLGTRLGQQTQQAMTMNPSIALSGSMGLSNQANLTMNPSVTLDTRLGISEGINLVIVESITLGTRLGQFEQDGFLYADGISIPVRLGLAMDADVIAPPGIDSGLIAFEEVESNWLNNTQRSQSQRRYNVRQVGHSWGFRIQTIFMARSDWQKLVSFIDQQRGRNGTFSYTSVSKASPLGSLAGSTYKPTVEGSTYAGGGTTVDVTGLPESEIVWFAGDFLKFDNHSKVYAVESSSITSSSSGYAMVTICPELFAPLSDGEAIAFEDVRFTASFTDDNPTLPVEVTGLSMTQLSLREVP